MFFLQNNNISHRDLKPANIFIQKNANRIKIGDFGCSRDFSTIQNNNSQN